MANEFSFNGSIATQGYNYFLAEKKKMLARFDLAKLQSEAHEAEPFYKGIVAEAEFRNWLSTFLPKRFGVTSGFIVSQKLSIRQKTPHFDVIIYDRLNSPVIGVEASADVCGAGYSLVLPAEHVLSVIEIKATLNADNAKKAIDHLGDLSILSEKIDENNIFYKKHLPRLFSSYIVFFEMKNESPKKTETLINKLIPKKILRGYRGGLVLRVGESNYEKSMRINLSKHNETQEMKYSTDSSQFQMFAFSLLDKLSNDRDGKKWSEYFELIPSYHGFPIWMFQNPSNSNANPESDSRSKEI